MTNDVIDYKAMKYPQLKSLCKEKGVSTKGKRDELIKNLRADSLGQTKFVPGMTLCKVCRQRAAVIKTEKTIDTYGRPVIIRTMRCTSRHRHQYPLYETLKEV